MDPFVGAKTIISVYRQKVYCASDTNELKNNYTKAYEIRISIGTMNSQLYVHSNR